LKHVYFFEYLSAVNGYNSEGIEGFFPIH
jgi:hypothetical protein